MDKELQTLYKSAYKKFDTPEGLKESEVLFQKAGLLKDTKMQAKALLIKAKYLNNHLDYKDFAVQARKLMKWMRTTKNFDEYYHIWLYVIINYYESNQYIEAYNEINKLRSMALNDNSSYGIQGGYRMLGGLYESRLAYRDALTYYKKELDYALKIKSPTTYACYYNIASCLYNTGRYEEALAFSIKGRRLSDVPPVINHFNMQEAIIYGIIGNTDRFIDCYNKVKAFQENNSLDPKAKNDYALLEVEKKWTGKDYKGAQLLINKLDEATKLLVMPIFYKKQNKYQEALLAQERLTLFRDSLNNSFSTTELNEFGNRLAQQKLLHEKQQLVIENFHIKNTQRFAIGFSIIIVLFAFIVTLFMMLNLLRKKQKIIATENESKDRFIQDMSHEIRTPLNAINGFIPILTGDAANLEEEEKINMVGAIQKNAKLLTDILHNVLTMFDLETGLARFEFNDVNPVSVCTNALDAVSDRIPAGVDVIHHFGIPVDFEFYTDSTKLSYVLTSLLLNACKFTEKGEITIGCNTTENKGKVTFYVADTGCGIPDDKAELIFHRFVKLNRFKTGLGLGLTIDRLILQQLHGTIRLDTKYKNGARFVIVHPIRYKKKTEIL